MTPLLICSLSLITTLLFMVAAVTVASDTSRRGRVEFDEMGREKFVPAAPFSRTAFFDRVMRPIGARLFRLVERLTPVEYVHNTRSRLLRAGLRGPNELDRFMAIRILTIGAIPFVWVATAFASLPGRSFVMVDLLLTFVLVIGPEEQLKKRVRDRQKEIRRSLPDVLDLLTISVEAGLGFEQAIDRIIDAVPGVLADEFSRMNGEIRAGADRADAFRGLENRTGVEEIKSFVLSMLQADTFGVPMGRILRSQSEELRIARSQYAHEQAQKAPVKMLVPMTFFIFPSLLVVVLGPAMMNIANNL